MSFNLPGKITDQQALWDIISKGKRAPNNVPFHRWDHPDTIDTMLDPKSKSRMMFGSFISGWEEFDNTAFRISKAEAAGMDPQQRMLLTCALGAFQDAGYTMDTVRGMRCGVYLAYGPENYYASKDTSVYSVGWSGAAMAGRVSFVFDLKGPSAAFDTACARRRLSPWREL